MGRARKDLGERGEAAALAYLQDLDYRLLERNHRQRTGELDLILCQQQTLVFCEVKTSRHGNACEGYSPRQQKRARRLILSYLARSAWSGPLRVDLLALEREPESPHYRVHHFQDVLQFDEP
jgi:putative endonuclease